MCIRDRIGAFGDASVGTTGFVNNANVPVFVLPNAGAWSGLTPAQILENLNAMAQAVVDQTIEIEEPDTLILPTAEYGLIAATPFLGGDGTETILSVFLRNSPYITAVEQWSKLNGAGAGGLQRAICYKRDPMVLVYNIPVSYTHLRAHET